jgi:hypothetical protein
MKVVHIRDGVCQGKPINGDYPFVSEKTGPAGNVREMTVRIVRNGKEVNVQANRADYTVTEIIEQSQTAVQQVMSPEMIELNRRIKLKFDIMAKLTEFLISGYLRALIISGAPGIGKSFNLEQRLNKEIDSGDSKINKFTILKGKISAIALFKQLFDHKDEGDILVLDDIDIVFQDETSLNILKAALDTGDKRHLVWLTASAWLEENGVDQEFDFEGACVFITNKHFDQEIERGSVLSEHLKAFINRSTYLDLGIHTNLEILCRIKQVVNGTTMLEQHGINDTQKQYMLTWLDDNYPRLREISLRTILKLSAFMRGDPQGWQDIAEATMVKYDPTYSVESAVRSEVSGAAQGANVLAQAAAAVTKH